MGDFRPDPDRPGRWLHLPDAATPVTPADYDPSATRVDLPEVPAGRVDYDEFSDYSNPTGDVADHNDPLAEDPTPDEIADPAHPDYVEPWDGA